MSQGRPDSGERVVLGPDRLGVSAVYEGGALVWRGVAGTASGPGPAGADADRRTVRLPCPDAVLQPGCVNAHTHLYSGLVPYGVPLPEPWPSDFVTILERLWWRLDRALDEPTLRAAARVAVGEALLAGTTTLIDHHESPAFIAGSLGVLAAECERWGLRALLCYGATERNGGRDEARAGLAECGRFVRERAQGASRGTLGGLVGLHASFTVSDATIREAVALAKDLDVGLHIHVAEAPADVTDATERGYAGVLRRLDALGALGPETILAHGIHLSPDEIRLANARGAWFVQNPRSNRGNGVGYPRGLVHAERVALGTDGYPSKMADEVAVAREEGQRFDEPEDLPERRLAAGRKLAAQHLGGVDLDGDLVAMGPTGAVHAVVAGRLVVRDGRLVGPARSSGGEAGEPGIDPVGGAGTELGTLQRAARGAASALTERMRYLE